MNAPIPVIAGPTASGKSALALEWALANNGVIINADSLQVYDALPMLTAQPSAEDRARVTHRLYGVLPPDEICSAAKWCQMAAAEIRRAHEEGKNPVIVGGTGFYIEALTIGLSPIPDIDPAIRMRGNALQAELGNPGFHAMLAKRDTAMTEKLHPNDTQRLIRAWEVLEGTGKSLAYWQSLPPQRPAPDLTFAMRLVMPPRDELRRRCDYRFDQMMANGVLDEVRTFMKTHPHSPPGATQALGFKPLRDHLNGLLSLEDAVALSKIDTKQYAKRQVTWFRRYS